MVPPHVVAQTAVAAALLGAMSWSLATYYFGIPVSETHGLIGGIVGVGIYSGGVDAVNWSSVVPVLGAIVISPVFGFLGGCCCSSPSTGCSSASSLGQALARSSISSASLRFTWRSATVLNDAEKPMGVLAMALAVYFGWETLSVPAWVILSCGVTAGLGVAVGGWLLPDARFDAHLNPGAGESAGSVMSRAWPSPQCTNCWPPISLAVRSRSC
jgi:PiT family inorganic phosphate transporter